MGWETWKGKKVFIKLRDGRIFSNTIVLSNDNSFIQVKDKYGIIARIAIDSISVIQEEGGQR